MCGIVGIVGIGRRLPEDAPLLVEEMRGTIAHRGPDGSGQWGDDTVILGHQRLSILDVSDAAAQPMHSASRRLVIVFNGEIYNFHDVAERLRTSGWEPTSSSDTEVLIEAFDRWGIEETLDIVDGMYAFAVYDRQNHHLTLGRDRFGEKPLYYGIQKDLLYFASELRAFEVDGGPELFLDESATTDYFRYGYVPAPKSIYHGFFKVRPAHLIRVDLFSGQGMEYQELPSRRYWDIPRPTGGPVASDEELRHTLRQSVTRRLVSDRPIGAFLSGGVDSSLTCALAAESMSGSLRTFTMGWEDEEYDESQQALSVAKAIGSVHHQVEASMDEAAEIAAQVGKICDEPFADSSLIATYLVAREARKDFVVALSGDGGDEMFAGYNRHRWLVHTAATRQRMPQWSRRRISGLLQGSASFVGVMTRPIPVSRRPRLISDKVRKLARAVSALDGRDAYEEVASCNQGVPGDLVLPAEVVEALNSNSRTSILWGLRSADILGYLPDDVLTKVDRASMAVSLESRTPFLQPDIATIALGMSCEALISDGQGKQPLRRFLDDLLPSCDFSQPKSGFGTPVASLLRGPLAARTQEAIKSFARRDTPITVASVNWTEMYEKFTRGDDSKTFHIWSVLVFELWASERRSPVVWNTDSKSGRA